MTKSQPQPNKDKDEAFKVGSLAVVNYDGNEGQSASELIPTRKVNKIGAFIIAKADEKLLEPGEQLVTVIRRHPIGIIGIYAEMVVGIVGVITLVLLAIFVFFASLSSGSKGLIAAGALFVVAFLVVILLISTYVYRQCRLIVSDQSVVQVLQKALFNRKISRLSMSNVEDVNVMQNGILPTMLNYGTLTIQTAGEVDNFIFTFCPKPNDYANQILEARQRYAQAHNQD